MRIQWVDEDEQDAAPEDDALGGMGGMGGMGGGMPGMEGLGGDGGFGGIGKYTTPCPLSASSQSVPPLCCQCILANKAPDFSKLGGGAGGGMPDLGDLGGDEGDDEDDDDAEMPGLENEEVEGKGKGKVDASAEDAPKTGGAKIEEIP